MNDLSAIAALLYDAADELMAENDRAEAREPNRAVDPLVERMAANRRRMNPSLIVSDVGQPRPNNTGLIVGNFVAGYGARK
jgi:hypothetical protein